MFYSFMTSEPFYILVGPEKVRFMMHAELLARQSIPLYMLVKGRMKEAAEGVAEWPEVDPDTFIRFSQYAYTGDYDPEAPKLVPPPLPPSARLEDFGAKSRSTPIDSGPPAKREKQSTLEVEIEDWERSTACSR